MTERGDKTSGDSLRMSLSVILINWRDERQTLQCVDEVRSWLSINPNIIVVDNESSTNSQTTLAKALLPHELICSGSNLGYAGGNNLAIKQVLAGTDRYILLLNTDAQVSEKSVMALLATMNDNPEISILGPVIYEGEAGKVKCLIGGRDIAQHASTRIEASPESLATIPGYPLHDVDYVSGTVLLARSSVFEQLGLLDEQYFFSGEIADFCKRAKNEGHKACVDLSVEAFHDTGKTPSQRRETLYTYYSLRNRFLYVRKHYASRKFRYFIRWTTTGLSALAKSIVARNTSRSRAILLAVVHGLSNRIGNQNARFE